MKPIKLVRTTYGEAETALGLDDINGERILTWAPRSAKENQVQILKDLRRDLFISEHLKFEEYQEDWMQLAYQKGDTHYYTQGDISGGLIPNSVYMFLIAKMHLDTSGLQAPPSSGRVCFCYINDEDEYASFRVEYILEDPTQWVACVMENLLAPYDERPYSIYLHNIEFKNDEAALWSSFESLAHTLKSKSVAAIVSQLFNFRDRSVNLRRTALLDKDTARFVGGDIAFHVKTAVNPTEVIEAFKNIPHPMPDYRFRLMPGDAAAAGAPEEPVVMGDLADAGAREKSGCVLQ